MFKCEKYTLIIILQNPSLRLTDTQTIALWGGDGCRNVSFRKISTSGISQHIRILRQKNYFSISVQWLVFLIMTKEK